MKVSESELIFTTSPPKASASAMYSRSGSSTMTSESGSASNVLMMESFACTDFPRPGLPRMKPLGELDARRL